MNTDPNGALPSLKDVFSGDFLIGAAIDDDQVSGRKPGETALILEHFNSVTPENCLKWATVHPRPDRWDWSGADRFVAFGERHGLHVVGHILIDRVQVPEWVFEESGGRRAGRETLLRHMEEYVTTVVGRYRGRIDVWQVVNEAIGPDGRMADTPWLRCAGEDYVVKAFEFAHRADPDAGLSYNGHDMLARPATDAIVRLVREIRAQGGRVDGVGVQAHWSLDAPTPAEAEAGLAGLRAADVKLAITEMDVTVLPAGSGANPYADGLPGAAQEQLAARYASLFALFLEHRGLITRVNFWGVHDGQSWLNDWPVAGRTDHPLLFDRALKPKPAFFAVAGTRHDTALRK